MAFLGVDDFATALVAAPDINMSKSAIASQAVGFYTSLWRSTGIPAQGAIPTTAAVCNSSLTGCFPLPARAGAQERALLFTELNFLVQNGFNLCDRLAHMGGLSGIVTTAQTASVDVSGAGSNLVARIGATDYSNVRWFIEIYTALGATGVNATCAVTFSDNSTGNIVVALPASAAAQRLFEIIPTGSLAIKSVQSVTLSATTGTAGNFGVTAMRFLSSPATVVANVPVSFDWAQLGAQKIEDSACQFPVLLCIGSTNPNVTFARMKIGVK